MVLATTSLAPEGTEFFRLIRSYLAPEAYETVRRAFDLARLAHKDDLRKSGAPYFTHPLTVAHYLADYRLDAPALAAALLHDVVEDTPVKLDEIRRRFGPEITQLVDGVTKLEHVASGPRGGSPLTREEKQDYALHKLIEAMTTDVRVVLIKLFDRLHNLRTIQFMSHASQLRTARESLYVYAPMANRLGLWDLKNELEERSLAVTDPEAHQILNQRLERLRHEQQAAFARVSRELAACLTEAGINLVKIDISPRSLFSTYQSCVARYGEQFDPQSAELESVLRIAILLEDIPSCYKALGEVHQLWRPVRNTFDDYIAVPRDNLYRSLHTTVVYPNGAYIKIRLRTVMMNVMAGIGVLARWAYKDSPYWSEGIAQRVEALYNNVSDTINLEPHNPALGVQGVVADVFSDQIIVYTPKGDARELPQGATPVDFAYAIHTEVGHQARHATVNSNPAPLNRPLSDGDRVFISKRGRPRPDRHWLDEDLGYVQTSRARSRIRRWFRRLQPDEAVRQGEKLLAEELTILGLPDYPHEWLADLFGYDDATDLYAALGLAELLTTTVATRLLAVHWELGPLRHRGALVESARGEKFVITNAGQRSLRLCQSCNPRPSEPIVGFVRTSGKVTIHRESCFTLPDDPRSERLLKLGWGAEDTRQVRPTKIVIEGHDRSGLLYEVLALVQSEKINMSYVEARTGGDKATILLELEVTTPRQLVRILHRTLALVNVYVVRCVRDSSLLTRPKALRPDAIRSDDVRPDADAALN